MDDEDGAVGGSPVCIVHSRQLLDASELHPRFTGRACHSLTVYTSLAVSVSDTHTHTHTHTYTHTHTHTHTHIHTHTQTHTHTHVLSQGKLVHSLIDAYGLLDNLKYVHMYTLTLF